MNLKKCWKSDQYSHEKISEQKTCYVAKRMMILFYFIGFCSLKPKPHY